MSIASKNRTFVEYNPPNRRIIRHLGGGNRADPVSHYNRESPPNTCFRDFWLIPHSRPGDK